MAASYVRRRLEMIYTLGYAQNQLGGTGGPNAPPEQNTFDGFRDTLTVSGLRMSASIAKPGGITQGQLDLRAFGISLSDMNKMATLGAAPLVVNLGNTIKILAGDDEHGMALVYGGTVSNAWPDFAGAPDVAFCVSAFGALDVAMMSIPPGSYSGGADVATIMGNLAKQMGKQFENGGVSVQLDNPYFPGSAYEQAERCAKAADINLTLDDGTLAIWPKGSSRGGLIPLISPETGMVGYPVPNQIGVDVRTLFNPSVRMGGLVEIKSSLTPACGKWQVSALYHDLESETPNGQWFSRLSCLRPGYL